jgi:hypothetical protein
MMNRADRFLAHFAILFLCVLLLMFGMFWFMRANDGRAIADTWLKGLFPQSAAEGALFNFGEAFRVNLFIIDLSLLLVLESLLILLFVRYTVPALLISCVAMVIAAVFGPELALRDEITRLLAPLVRNNYAALGLRDTAVLLLLNALLLAFMIAMRHHYQALQLHVRAAPTPAPANPTPATPAQQPDKPKPEVEAAAHDEPANTSSRGNCE